MFRQPMSQYFHDEGMSRSAARAQRSATESLATAFGFVDHGDYYSSAGCTDRMADADAGTDNRCTGLQCYPGCAGKPKLA